MPLHEPQVHHIHQKGPHFPRENGAGSRTRTDDLLITNQLLYQLSYTGLCKIASQRDGSILGFHRSKSLKSDLSTR